MQIKKMIKFLIKISELLKLWVYSENKWSNFDRMIKENSFTDRETILHLKKNPKIGIIRHGNSELGFLIGNSPKTQKYNKKLKNLLVETFKNYNSITNKKYILAIPLDFSKRKNLPNWYPGKGAKLAMKLLVSKKQIYGSPFCFRIFDVLDEDIEDYIILVKSLFLNRDIIYVGPLVGENEKLPNFIKPVEVLKIPEKDAFEKFDDIVSQIKKLYNNYKDPIVVVVGGLTASVISYKLNMSNITCYDFGQYQRIYKKYLKTINKKD